MRLINADELKKALSNKDLITWTHEYGNAIPVDWIISTIDNAPTVKYPFYQEAYQTGYEEGKNERPQGEWIIEHLPKNINNLNDCYTCVSCSECGFHYDYMFHQCNVCPNCGADMRGKENG